MRQQNLLVIPQSGFLRVRGNVARIFSDSEIIESKILTDDLRLLGKSRTSDRYGRNPSQFRCYADPRPRGCAAPSAAHTGDDRIAAFLPQKLLKFFHLRSRIDIIRDLFVGNILNAGISLL